MKKKKMGKDLGSMSVPLPQRMLCEPCLLLTCALLPGIHLQVHGTAPGNVSHMKSFDMWLIG